MGDLYPVLAGLREGERVVIHGAFAIDADLQIQGGDSMMTVPDDEEAPNDQTEASKPAASKPPASKPPAPKKRKPREPPAPTGGHEHHMQGH